MDFINKNGKDAWKYEKIYNREGVLTKAGGFSGAFGSDKTLDNKWTKYGKTAVGKKFIKKLKKHLKTSSLKNKKILDVGCGHNKFVELLRMNEQPKNPRDFLGVDIACTSADIIAPAHNIPLEDKKIDVVCSFDCMEHIPEEEVLSVFKEFRRLSDRIFLQISLAESETMIDGEPVHVCVKSSDWWLDQARTYFPESIIKMREGKGKHKYIVITSRPRSEDELEEFLIKYAASILNIENKSVTPEMILSVLLDSVELHIGRHYESLSKVSTI